MRASVTAATALLAAMVSAHGNVVSPPARGPGAAMAAACGQENVQAVTTDPTIPLEDLTNPPATCRQHESRDTDPHEGPMNVSIVDTATNKAIGEPLIVFDSYADEKLAQLPANNTNFDITMPSALPAGACAQAGQCVVQWFWFGTSAKQTYESCVDFVMG
ncbi:chitin binding protein [Colletotrichum tofieldiae]|nr:chitin binding protein [Colletotrichum tofieldiae]